MKRNKVIYSLDVEDVQTVALEEIERELTPKELERIIDVIGEKIHWYDIIEASITHILKLD